MNVIGMFVGDQDCLQRLRRAVDLGQPLPNLAPAEPRIDENPSLFCFQVGAVASGTAPQNRQSNRHALDITLKPLSRATVLGSS